MGMIGNVYQLLILRLLSGAFTGTFPPPFPLFPLFCPRETGVRAGTDASRLFSGDVLGPWIGGMIADSVGYRLTL